jgi:hypothetical protein
MNRQRQSHVEKNIICILIFVCILSLMFMAVINILIGCNVISFEKLPHTYIYYIIGSIRWSVILCIFLFYLKGLWVNHKYKLKSGITLTPLPFYILFIIIYCPFYLLPLTMIIWIMLDFIATVYFIYTLFKIMIEIND